MTNLNPVFEPLKQVETFLHINPFENDPESSNEVETDSHAEAEPSKLEDYEYLRITDKTIIPYPVPILKINGDRVATPGAIVTVSGQPKSGKSAFTGIVVAGAISTNGEIDGLPGVEVLPNEDCKAVIHCDTEQDRYTHQYNHKTILKRAGFDSCPDYFLSYNIRQLDLSQYQPYVNDICEAADLKFNGIHSIFIDGGADFIKSVNDETAAFEIVDYFDKLAQTYNTAIFVIVHTNPGSEKERGHLGSQFQRKSTGILSVKKEGNISYLDPKLMRFTSETAKIQFKYDKEKGYHVQCNENEDSEDAKAIERLEKVKQVCESVFSGQRSYEYGSAVDAIMRQTKRSVSIAKSMFTDMKVHEMIIQGLDKNWRINSSGIVV
jgi:hypothetical protein